MCYCSSRLKEISILQTLGDDGVGDVSDIVQGLVFISEHIKLEQAKDKVKGYVVK